MLRKLKNAKERRVSFKSSSLNPRVSVLYENKILFLDGKPRIVIRSSHGDNGECATFVVLFGT